MELLGTVAAAGAFASMVAATLDTDADDVVNVAVVVIVKGIAVTAGVGGASNEDSLRVRL